MNEDGSVNHLEKLNILFRLMEKFVRGKGTREDAQEVIHIGEKLFDWTLDESCIEGASAVEEKVRNDFASIAIKLHNKTRSLPPKDCQEMRALLKPVSALLLYRFHPHSVKALSTIIRLLTRGGMELREYLTTEREASSSKTR